MRHAERLALLAWAVLAVGPAHAADDRDAPISVAADSADIDRNAGRSLYRGNVLITQGSIRITADEVELTMVGDELDHATILGKPATFEQTPPGASAPTRGMAQRMVYLARDGIVELHDDARVQQQGDEVAGQLIRYDTRQNRVLAASGATAGERVQMTITPRKPKPTTPPPPEPPAR